MSSFIPSDYSQIQRQIKSEKENGYWGGYFAPGVYGGTPTQKKMYSGRILPAFNYNMSMADSEFPRSWMPYRNVDNIDPDTNQPVLSAFFAVVAAYSWFGNKQVSFLSPATLRYTQFIAKGPELIDPVQDIRNYAKKHEDPAIRALTERPENKKDAKIVIPYAQRRYVFNFYGTVGADRTVRNYLIDVSQKAFEDLAAKLAEWRPSHEQILDQNWPNYLYGDITDPSTGIMVETVPIPSTPQPFNGFVFTSGSHKSLKGVKQMPVPEEALTGRYHLYGDKSAFKVMSAQEIVDFLVEDGAIPYHLIEEVCSNYAHIPAQPKMAKVFPGSRDSDEEGASHISGPAMPRGFVTAQERAPEYHHNETRMQVPPAAVEAPQDLKRGSFIPMGNAVPPPPPAKPTAGPKYWLSLNDEIDMDRFYTANEIQEIMDREPGSSFMVCEESANIWQSPVEIGLKLPAKPRAAPPPLPAKKEEPEKRVPPPLPSVAPTSAPPVTAKAAPAKKAQLTDEEQAEFENLKAQFESNSLPPSDLAKFVQYVNRIEGNA